MAVRDGRIVAIGSNDDIRKLKRSHTAGSRSGRALRDAGLQRRTSASGRRRTGPGLEVDLVGVKSLAEMQQRIAEHAKTTPPEDWIIGRGWDHTLWPGEKLPTRQDIDAVTGDHPAILVRVDGHIRVANTAALKAAGILRRSPIRREARSIATRAERPPASFARRAKD